MPPKKSFLVRRGDSPAVSQGGSLVISLPLSWLCHAFPHQMKQWYAENHSIQLFQREMLEAFSLSMAKDGRQDTYAIQLFICDNQQTIFRESHLWRQNESPLFQSIIFHNPYTTYILINLAIAIFYKLFTF